MYEIFLFVVLLLGKVVTSAGNDVLGCGGYIKSHVPIDFSKVEVKLLTKQGILKDKTNCAPNNGYYFLPLYDKGEYSLELDPPPGWSFNPTKVNLNIDGNTDLCSQGKDINFVFKGFGITGKVESLGDENEGPQGVTVELKSAEEIRKTTTDDKGNFFFTPVFPGSYSVSISHPKWKILKQSVNVKVAEGNTDLPPKSLIVKGYDVTGSVKSEGEPVKDTTILLFTQEGVKNIQADGCTKGPLPGVLLLDTFVCYVKSDANGIYTFPTIPNGNYYVVLHYKEKNIHFQPSKIDFTVNHNSVIIPTTFEIIGFSIPGFVLSSENGKPIPNAKVFLNNKEVATTKPSGRYKLEKMKVGIYKLNAEAEGLIFNEIVVKINPSSQQLPNLVPAAYKVCGTVISDSSQTVTISRIGSTQIYNIQTDSNTGKFCEYLSPGKYNVVVTVDKQKQRGLQFFPITQTIEVTTDQVSDIVFSQLKATVHGKVQCIRSQDCEDITVSLKPTHNDGIDNTEIHVKVIDGKYTIKDIFPGNYEVILHSSKLCWKSNKQVININNATVDVPPFLQTGYSIIFVSSHDTKVSFKTPGQSALSTIEVNRGKFTYCVEKPGNYIFELSSCHSYPSNTINYSIDSDGNEVLISAEKHSTKLAIQSDTNYGDITVSVKIGSNKNLKQLSYKSGFYELDLLLSPTDSAVVVPQSEILYFNPPILSINGNDDCENLGVKFKAVKGKVFRGKVIPALAGVSVSVESENTEILLSETDSEGKYKFPPLDDTKQYKLTAKKDSYVLVGPNENGDFHAHKLAEIVVEVLDEADKSPLQGALLSLSGGESYRSNLQTDQNGKIAFHSLSPSEYFLRPMMKEYRFEPTSKIIPVKEGQTVNVQLIGKRVAYSVFGQVTSLNGEPEENMIVVATGKNNCSHFSEESTSESTGQFRIRGLQPYCSYNITVKGSLDDKQPIERSAPSAISLENVAHDVTNLKLIVFRPVTNMDILVKVYADNPEHYKSLRLKLSRESSPSGLVHSSKIDTSSIKITKDSNPGVLVHLTPIQLDGKSYSIQLESSLSQNVKWNPQLQFFTANSTFKYLELNFSVKCSVTEHLIKQTSIWSLVLVFTIIFAGYNIETIAAILKDKFNFNISCITNLIPQFAKKNSPEIYDNAQIDKIVQSIESKKKSKTKKVS